MNSVVPDSTHFAAPDSTRPYCTREDTAARRKAALIFLLVLGCQSFAAHGQEEPVLDEADCRLFVEPGTADFDISQAPQPAEDVQFPENAVVNNVVFTRYPIFNENDPAENNRLFQLVDFLHIDTRPDVIGDQLLFEEGDPFSKRIMEESARALRDSDYLYDARVWPYRICGNRVDVEVLTREVWTLTGGASVSRSGGADETEVSISDSNFLGYGKTFSLSSTSSTDRDGIEFKYEDPNVAGSRYTLDVLYADNDDGFHTVVHGERPFYSLDTRYAWGVRYSDQERVDDIYERGEDVAAYQRNETASEIYMGKSGGRENGVTKRWWFGLHAGKSTYSSTAQGVRPDSLPADRESNYPFLRFDFIEEDFIQVTNLNQMHRIEDFNLGRSWSWRLGLADTVFGSDADRLVYHANYRNAWKLNGSTLMQLESRVDGLWLYNEDQTEELLWETSWRWYNGAGKKHGTYLAMDVRMGRHLSTGQELLLGSEEQLRGYPARYQKGNRSVVFTAERRYYTDWHLWRLLRVGGAVFFDVGRAWEPGDELSGPTGVLADVGFGLRLASSRAQSKQILHVDIAFPFQREDDVDSVQVLLTAKQSF